MDGEYYREQALYHSVRNAKMPQMQRSDMHVVIRMAVHTGGPVII